MWLRNEGLDYHFPVIFFQFRLGGADPPPKKKKKKLSPKSVYPPTHPRVFVRFGSTKGEIRVKRGDFRGDLGGF